MPETLFFMTPGDDTEDACSLGSLWVSSQGTRRGILGHPCTSEAQLWVPPRLPLPPAQNFHLPPAHLDTVSSQHRIGWTGPVLSVEGPLRSELTFLNCWRGLCSGRPGRRCV